MLDVLANDDNSMVMMSNEAHFHSMDLWTSRITAIGLPRIPDNSTRDLFTAWRLERRLLRRDYWFLLLWGWRIHCHSDFSSIVEMLNTFLGPKRQRRGVEASQLWFQQDGATAHTARISMKRVQEMFPRRVISRFGDVHWLARSPDLSVCDFFPWGT